ncbi:MAG: hypothetical protein P0S96_02615 [Simkaniaceae bacterium]|nr:hypothetical protein [Candidatus Sacchlamyda saccharinae]
MNFNATVNLVEQVRAVQSDPTFTFIPNANITINGMNQTLNGQGTTRGFFVGGRNANSTGMVTINDLLFSQCRAKGVMAKVVAWELAAAFLLGKALL